MMTPKSSARVIVAPRTTGVSLCLMLVTINVPKPGMENMVSVMTAPPSRPPKDVAVVVMMGSSAFRSACLKTITAWGIPLA